MNEQDKMTVTTILQAAGKGVNESVLMRRATVGINGRVIRLSLFRCVEVRELPPEIGLLSQLEILDLRSCSNLTTLPPEIGQLSQLKELNLSNCNELTTLPPEIGQLSMLEMLNLNSCKNLTTLLPEIGQLPQLKELHLYNCIKLTTLPATIGQLSELEKLYLGCENLTTLPPEIGQLSKLEILSVFDCENLRTLPPEIGKLLQLKELNLSDCNKLTTLPPDIGQLLQLVKLDLRGLYDLTMLPPEIGKLSKLEELDLGGCENLTTLPPEIGQLSQLKELYLRGCENLTTLPPEIGQLSKLEELNLKGCEALSVPVLDLRSRMNREKIISFVQDLFIFLDSPATSLDLLRDKPDLLFCAVQTPDPIYASAVAAVFKAHPTLKSLRDSNGRTALELACRECRQEVLFYKRYFLEERPRHKSTTCKVFFAVDYDSTNDSMNGRPVALKFMEHKDHLDAELKARKCDNDDEDRFDKKYVIVALGHHNGDDDPKFLEATKRFNLPKYCLVLEQGERSLGDAILNENISNHDFLTRQCLKELAEALQHIHQCGYVHCDVKPKNVIREVALPRKWKVTDFDGTTKKGETMGNKVSTGYLAPELVSMINGRPVLRCLCVFDDLKRISIAGVPAYASDEILREDKVALAHESIDAWSFGCLAYLLITGEPLIGKQDVYDNLDEDGLWYLGHWGDWALLQALKKVHDPSASDLLQGLLHPDPRERLSIADTLKHRFFHPDEVAKENEKLQQKRDVVDQVRNVVKRELQAHRTALDKKLGEIAAGITELKIQLQTYHGATSKMLATILKGGIVPRYVCLIPHKVEGKLLAWSKPTYWINKRATLYFVCPVTFSIPKANNGNTVGYTFSVPHDWVKKYGPALLFSLNVLKVACGVGRLAGLPLPVLSDVVDTAKQFIGSHTEFLTVLYDAIRADEDIAPIGDWIDGQFGAYTDVPMPVKCQQLTEASYENVKMLAASKQINDRDFLKCGLKRALCENDGSAEFVASSVHALYEKRGRECLNLTEGELKKYSQEEELLAERRRVQKEERLTRHHRVEGKIPELEENEEEFQC